MKKRILSVLMAVAFGVLSFGMVTVHAAGVEMAVESQVVCPAEGTVQVPVILSGNTGIAGMTVSVGYDEELTLTGAVKGDALPNLTFTKPGSLAVNPAKFLWDNMDADFTNGTLMILTFDVPSDMKDYEITLKTSGVFDGNLDDVDVTTVNGKVTVAHIYGDWKQDDDYNHIKECACGDVVFEEHDWDDGVVTTEPTHFDTGVLTYTCSVCSGTKTEILPIIPHSHGDWYQEDDYNHIKECECGDVIREDHDWDDGVVTTEPTHFDEGVLTYTCSVCSGTKTESIPVIPHSYGKWYQDDDYNHIKKCECGHTISEEHTWNKGIITLQPTLTADGIRTYKCSVCSGTKTEVIDMIVNPDDFTNVTVADGKVRVGKEVVIPVAISNNVGLTGLQLDCEYDTDTFTLTDIEVGTALSGLEFTKSGDLGVSPVTLLWDGMDADNSNGDIALLKFTALETAEVGKHTISVTVKAACDQDTEDVIVCANAGTVIVKQYTPGDVNDDENINAKDVILMRRHITGGYGDEMIIEAADVDQNDEVNAKDVILMRRYITGGYGVEFE